MPDGGIDLASLLVKFDATSVTDGTAAMEKAVPAAKALETQVKSLNAAETQLTKAGRDAMGAHNGVAQAVSGQVQALTGLTGVTSRAGAGITGLTDNLTGLGGASSGVASSMVRFALSLGPVGVGVAAVVAGLAAAGVAALQASRAMHEMEAATYGVGRATGLTGGQLQALADGAAKAGDVSQASAEKMVAGYVRLGLTSSAVLAQATELTKDYAAATGEDLKSAQKELGAALAAPINGIDTLSKSIGGVDGATKEYIVRMVRENELGQAQAAMLAIVARQTGHAAEETDRLSKSLDHGGIAFSNFFKAAGNFVLRSVSPRDKDGLTQTDRSFGYNPLTEPSIEKADATAKANKLQAESNALALAGDAAVKGSLPHLEQMNKLRADQVVLNRLLAAGDDVIAKSGHTRAEINRALVEGEAKLKDLALSPPQKKAQSAAESAAKSAATHAAELAREAAAAEATTAATLDLAKAYGVSDAAALAAQARVEAVGHAIKSRADQDAAVRRQVNQDAAKSAVDASKAVSDLKFQTDAQSDLNDAVAAGTISTQQAAEQLQLINQLRPLEAALTNASGEAYDVLARQIANLTVEYGRSAEVRRRTDLQKANEGTADRLAALRMEIALVGADADVRARRLAVLSAEQQLRAKGGYDPENPTPDQSAFIEGQKTAADLTTQLAQRQFVFNDALGVQVDMLRQSDAAAQSLAASLGDAFGKPGKALGQLLTLSSAYAVKQQEIADELDAFNKQAGNAEGADQRRAVSADKAAKAQIEHYGDLAGAAKGFFKEGSDGYRALQAVETTYRAVQLAETIKAIILKETETAANVTHAATSIATDQGLTASSVAKSAIRSAASGVEAIAKAMSTLPFPLNLAAGAATAAALVSFGVKLFGHGGSGGGGISAEERQRTQGTGSVLGDAAAKSDSISKALDIIAANTNADLEYQNPMLRALRSIDSNISVLTGQLAKQLNVGGAFDTSGLGLGSSSSGPGLLQRILFPIANVLPGLFGTKTTTSLVDQGLQFAPQTLGGIQAGGLEGDSYATTATTKKKKLFGVVISNHTTQSTATEDLDQSILDEMQRVVSSLRDGVLAAASTLGVQGAQATLDAFTVNLGTISFTGKTGEQIGSELEAVFSKLGDDLATAAVPGLTDLQKAGEGAFETLARVAREYAVVDTSLQSIGKVFGQTGLASLAARDDLVQLFGTLDDFASATQAFADDFLTEAERMAPIQRSVQDELARLGVTGVNTKEEFKNLVLSLDLTTEAGRQMYAQLLAVGPAFAKVADFLADGSKEIQDARDALSASYQRESDALAGTIDRFRQFSASLSEFRESLYTGPAAGLSPEAQYQAAQAKFVDVSRRASLGDEQALNDLQSVSQAYLDASRQYYASSGHYFADLAAVRDAVESAEATSTRTADNAAAQLDQLKASVSGLIEIDKSVISVHDAILNLTALLAAQATASGTPFSPLSTTGSPTVTTQPYGSPVAVTETGNVVVPAPANDTAATTPAGLGGYGGGGGFTGDPMDPNNPLRFEPQGVGLDAKMFFANGGAFGAGGIVTRPTAFQTGQGKAVAGEGGSPEGVLPLANIGGRLGVYASGGNDGKSAKLLEEIVQLLRQGNDGQGRLAEVVEKAESAGANKVVKALQDQSATERLKSGGIAA